MEPQTFPAGTKAACNRCQTVNALPKDCTGRLSHTTKRGAQVYRLDTMCTLLCGHMDAHWVIVEQ